MAQQIEAPDGSIVEFPDGTPDDVMAKAMGERFPPGSQFATPGVSASAYDPSWRDSIGGAISDVATSLGIGEDQARKIASGLVGSSGLGTENISVSDFVPGLGQALAFEEGKGQVEKGDTLSGALNIASAAIPAGRAPARAVAAGMRNPNDRLAAQAARINATRAPDAPQINIPKALDPNDGLVSRATSFTARRGADMPIVGAPLQRAHQEGRQAISDNITGAVARSGPEVPIGQAGDEAATSARGWVTGTSKREAAAAYDAVPRALGPLGRAQTGDLPHTTRILDSLSAEDAASFTSINQPVLNMITEAATNPGGITVEGAEVLRKAVSKLGKPQMAVAADSTAQPGFKRAAAALLQDVELLISRHGGAPAVAANNAAKALFREHHAPIRAAVGKILGKDIVAGAKSGENVINKMHSMAKSTGAGDSANLMRLQTAIGANEWSQMARAVNENMGRSAAGTFDPLKWAKELQKLSPNGRNTLFGPELAREFDDLSRIMTDYAAASRSVGNPSGSGTVATTAAAAAGFATNPVATVAIGLSGHGAMRYFSSPRVVRALGRVARHLSRGGAGVRDARNRVAGQSLTVLLRELAKQIDKAGGDGDAVVNDIMEQQNNGR